MLPMNLMGATTPVTQIEMNVVLPDGGTVRLRNLRLEPMEFGLGQSYAVTLLAASAALAVAVIWFLWRGRNRRSEDELKRMMAADA